jgi:hypothetical protein
MGVLNYSLIRGYLNTTFDTPVYTNKSTNPYPISLNAGQSQVVPFYINATGNTSTTSLMAVANLTSTSFHVDSEPLRIQIYSGDTSSADLMYPSNNYFEQDTSNTTFNFTCTAQSLNLSSGDLSLRNVTLHVWNYSDDLIIQDSEIASGNSYTANWTKSLPNEVGSYKWNCEANDTWNNSYFATSNFSIGVGNITGCTDLKLPNKVYELDISIEDSTEDVCFNVLAENVTLDCKNNLVGGVNGSDSIAIKSNKTNTTVRNCNIHSWGYAAYLNGSNKSRVEDSLFRHNSLSVYGYNLSQLRLRNLTLNQTQSTILLEYTDAVSIDALRFNDSRVAFSIKISLMLMLSE